MPVIGGLGAILKGTVGGSSAGIADVLSIHGPGIEVGVRDTTPLNPATGWRTKAGTITDPGVVTATIFWDYTNSQNSGLFNLLGVSNPPNVAWTVQTSDSHQFTFSGFLSKFELGDQTIDDAVTYDIEITLSGQITAS